ncbi:MAG: hypothetical protein GEU88_11730, partial [Solirubrobacterales bacterium]|nr:hypothetical protein [Solirubrobacterales bacterium]
MTDERLDRRALLRRATAVGAALALPAWVGERGALATPASARARILRPGGGSSLKDLARAVRGRVITHGSGGYAKAAEVYNERYDGARPLAIVEARGVGDVRAAVEWANRRDVHVVPR